MKIESPDEVYKWGEEELWNTYLHIKETKEFETKKEEEDFNKEFLMVKHGINMMFPIWCMIKQWYSEYPSGNAINIYGYGKYNLTDYMEELDQRKTIMRTRILEELEDDSPIQGRISKKLREEN